MWCFIFSNLWIFPMGLVAIAYCYVKKVHLFWAERRVAFRNPHWFFGNFRDFLTAKTPLAMVTVSIYGDFKSNGFGGIWRGLSPLLFVVDPKIIHDIMVKNFHTWSNHGFTVNEDVDPLSANLLNLDGMKWKSVRKKLAPTFTPVKLKHMFHLLLECGKSLEEHLNTLVASGSVDEAKDLSAKFTTDVIGSCAFGMEINSLKGENCVFLSMGKKIFEPSLEQTILRAMQVNCRPLFKLFKLSLQEREVTDFFLKLTKEIFEYREKNNVCRHDFMDLLRSLKSSGAPLEKDEVEFDDNLLAAQVFVFFAAGFETSSTAISFCFHELAHNQNIQDRLRNEVHEAKTANNGEITWDVLRNMKYLDMVVNEVLRKYPPAPVVTRMSVEPYRILGTDVKLPSNSECIIPVYAIHHDPEFYPDPEKFDPERFTQEAKSKRPPFTFIPFGGGPRVCIGQRFAVQQIKVALVSIVDKFEIHVCEKSENPVQLDPRPVFLSPKNGIWVRITANQSK